MRALFLFVLSVFAFDFSPQYFIEIANEMYVTYHVGKRLTDPVVYTILGDTFFYIGPTTTRLSMEKAPLFWHSTGSYAVRNGRAMVVKALNVFENDTITVVEDGAHDSEEYRNFYGQLVPASVAEGTLVRIPETDFFQMVDSEGKTNPVKYVVSDSKISVAPKNSTPITFTAIGKKRFQRIDFSSHLLDCGVYVVRDRQFVPVNGTLEKNLLLTNYLPQVTFDVSQRGKCKLLRSEMQTCGISGKFVAALSICYVGRRFNRLDDPRCGMCITVTANGGESISLVVSGRHEDELDVLYLSQEALDCLKIQPESEVGWRWTVCK